MNTLKFGNGEWYGKKDTILAYNDENSNFKPLPFSFDRASSATVINKDGLIETVGSGEPRIDFSNDSKGALLLEPSRSNIFDYSSDLSAWTKLNSTVTESSVLSLDGVNNSYVYERTSSSASYIYRTVSLANTTQYTLSFFAKSGTSTNIQTDIWDTTQSTQCQIQVDLTTKSVSNFIGTSYKIEDYTNDWIRISVNFTSESSFGTTFNRYFNVDSVGSELYIWGAQLEQGSYATSYIPTSGGVVTRVTDVLPITELRSKNILGSVSFSYLFDFTHQGGGTFSGFFNEVDDASLYKGGWVESGGLQYRTPIGGGNYYVNVKVPITSGDRVKCCVTLNGSTRKIYANGVLISTLNNCDNLSNDIDGFIQYYGNTNVNYESYRYNGLQVYNTELTDTEAIALTTI